MVARKINPGQSETDEVVRRYLARGPISMDDLNGYTIERAADGTSWLTLIILFDDAKHVPAHLPDVKTVSVALLNNRD